MRPALLRCCALALLVVAGLTMDASGAPRKPVSLHKPDQYKRIHQAALEMITSGKAAEAVAALSRSQLQQTGPAREPNEDGSGDAKNAPANKTGFDPTSGYEPHEVEGFKILVNKRLDKKPESKKAAIREIQSQLYQISRLIPAKAFEQLQKTTIWMEESAPERSAYHPDRNWLVKNGYNPEKAKCIEIASAAKMLSLPGFRPEMMLLHELMHAYHDQVLGFDHPAIFEAYNRVVKEKKYTDIQHIYGGQTRHYALTNHKEFFAELSESYLFANDYYPFVRPELKTYDRETYELLKKIWNGREPKRGE